MPLVLLLTVALASAVLTAVVAALYPSSRPGGATEDAVEEVVEHSSRLRRFLRARRDPEVATGLALTVALGVALAGGLVLALLAALVRGNDLLHDADSAMARYGNAHASHLSTRGLQAVTQLGEAHTVLVLGVAIALAEIIRTRRIAVIPFLLIVTLGASLLTNTVKAIVDRARPTLNPIAHTLGPSFPSGHSSTAAAFYAAAALLLAWGRPRWVRIALAATAVGLAVAVASSRVLLDVHWLSDVIGGLALGWAWFALCAIAFGGRLLRFGAPVEAASGKAPRVGGHRVGNHEV